MDGILFSTNLDEGETDCGGDDPVADSGTCTTADIISTVEFDHTGNYLATGDKGGRVVLFERNETVTNPSRTLNALLLRSMESLELLLICHQS